MLFLTEITNPAKRAAASDYLQSHEDWAATFATQCVPGSLVKLGPVQELADRITFELRGAGDGMLVAFVVTVAAGMPEADVWSTWAMALEIAGLRVKCDSSYETYCFSALERFEA